MLYKYKRLLAYILPPLLILSVFLFLVVRMYEIHIAILFNIVTTHVWYHYSLCMYVQQCGKTPEKWLRIMSPIKNLFIYVFHLLVACLSNYSHGLIWQNQSADTTTFKRCSELHNNFRFGVYASRKCSAEGEWEDVDFSNCTMHLHSDTVIVTQATITPADPSVVITFKALVSRCM